MKGKTSEKGFVCFLILYCIYCSINITVFFSNILLSLHIMTWFLALKTSMSFNMIKIYRKFFHTSTAGKSKLFHVIPYRHTSFRIFKNSLFFVKRQNDWMPFLKVYFKYLYFVVWNTTWLVRNKKIHFQIKNFTFKSSLIICR